jgi:Replication protein C (RepC)
VQARVAWSAQLLSWMQDDAGIHIALHPHISRVARGVAGQSPFRRRYTVLSLEERYSLEDPIARIAHAWLSCWLRRYETGLRTISLEKLADHVWGDTLNPRGEKQRMSRLRCALSDISELSDWILAFDGNDVLVLRGKLALGVDSGNKAKPPADLSVGAAELTPQEVDLLLTNQPLAGEHALFQDYQLRA